MATDPYSYEGGERTASASELEYKRKDSWSRQFIDDLVASNRFKTFLLSQGKVVPDHVRKGLADLSRDHQAAIMRFVEEERRPWSLRSFFPRWRRRTDSL